MSASPDTAQGFGDTTIVQTNSVAVIVQGGGVFTYFWTYDSGDASIDIQSGPSAQTQRWRAIGMQSGEDRSAIWKCTVSSGGSPLGDVMVPVFVQRF